MSEGYVLVNHTRKEYLTFAHVNASTDRELAANPASTAITTWYMLRHRGDRISFVSDSRGEWPFDEGTSQELHHYAEVTDREISELISEGILKDCGVLYSDPKEPETVYVRDLRNTWNG